MGFQAHGRSISLPSRVHPGIGSLKVEESLNKLKALEEDSSSSLPSIQSRLINLSDLYVSFTDLIIQSPSTQQSLSSTDIEEALEASLHLINTCTASRDIVSSLKDHVTHLQSALRRRSSIESHVASYTIFRKKSKKEIVKCLEDLKQTEAKSNKLAPNLLKETDLPVAMIIRVLREVVSISISVSQSLLLFLSVPSTRPKWSLLSRFGTGEVILNEVGCADVAILSLQSRKSGDLEAVKGKLRGLDSGCPKVENAVEMLLRRLLQNRVALLNILTNSH